MWETKIQISSQPEDNITVGVGSGQAVFDHGGVWREVPSELQVIPFVPMSSTYVRVKRLQGIC